MEVHSTDWAIMLIESVYEGPHTIVPKLQVHKYMKATCQDATMQELTCACAKTIRQQGMPPVERALEDKINVYPLIGVGNSWLASTNLYDPTVQ